MSTRSSCRALCGRSTVTTSGEWSWGSSWPRRSNPSSRMTARCRLTTPPPTGSSASSRKTTLELQ
uniref:Uncharacterized protein n=1 Tax=Anguilla anguilla TaxID=7936 RepID=A0A0E9WCE0_ANGAN